VESWDRMDLTFLFFGTTLIQITKLFVIVSIAKLPLKGFGIIFVGSQRMQSISYGLVKNPDAKVSTYIEYQVFWREFF
jgi:hypothetical protein